LSTNPAATLEQRTAFQVEGSDGGMLLPQMTAAQRIAIPSSPEGLWVYQTDGDPGMFVYMGGNWVRMTNKRSVTGKVRTNGTTEVLIPPGAGPYSATQNGSDLGLMSVSFSPAFSTVPTIAITSETLPPITVLDPTVYSPVSIVSHCNTCPGQTFCLDWINNVIVASKPGNVLNPAFGLNDNNNDECNGAPNGFVNHFATPGLTGLTISAASGSFYDMSVSTSYEWYDESRAFIDLNQDADFDLSEEVAHFDPNPSGGPIDRLVTISGLSIPPTTFNGITVMRILAKWSVQDNGPELPQGTLQYGECHNYKVTVIGGTNITSGDRAPRPTLCNVENVTTSGFSVRCSDFNKNSSGASFNFYATEH